MVKEFTPKRILTQLMLVLVTGLVWGGNVQGQQSLNMDLRFTWDDNTLPVSGTTAYNDIWGYAAGGREYAIIGTIEGFRVWDVTNPSSSVQVASEMGASTSSLWRDFKTYENYLYTVSDQGPTSSLQIYDLSGLPGSISKVYDSQAHFSTCHNIFIDESSGTLYAAGTTVSPSGVVILDVKTNPANPALLANFSLGAYVHDVYSHEDTLVAFFGPSGIGFFDFANLATPSMISYVGSYTDAGYSHSGWADPQFNTLYWATETNDTGIKISDFSNGYTGDVDGVFRSNLLGPSVTNSVPHNMIINGNMLYISYYHDGVQVYDISNRLNPTRVAYYDTHPQNTDYANFRGSWGIYPFLPSGNILSSDTENGLFVLSMTNVTFPVELADFRAEDQGDRIRLGWRTLSEVNNDYFEIERSANGIDFEPILRVDGIGNSQEEQAYETVDLSPLDGQSYYRLRQVDRDGSENFSEIIDINRARNLKLATVWPNPLVSGERMHLDLHVAESIQVEFVVVDVVGRIMHTEVRELAAGTQRIEIATEGWSAGSYAIKVGAGAQKFTRKVILTK